MSLKAWTVGMVIPLTASFAVSSATTASAAGAAPQVSSERGVVQAVDRVAVEPPDGRRPVFRDRVVKRPVFRDRVVKRPIFRDRVVKRPIFRDRVVKRPIFRDRVIVKRPIIRERVIVRPIVLFDPFVQCAPFFDELGNLVGRADRFDPLFRACAEFFGHDPE